MKEMNHFSGRTMHIDTSRRFYQIGDSAIAFKVIPTQEHKGMILSNNLKKELKRDLHCEEDYERMYAICIYYLIKDNLDLFENLVICNDEKYVSVKSYLDLLFRDNSDYLKKNITCLNELRRISGDLKLKSYADNIANIYRKKGLKSEFRKQRGVRLEIVEINYRKVKDKWEEIDKEI